MLWDLQGCSGSDVLVQVHKPVAGMWVQCVCTRNFRRTPRVCLYEITSVLLSTWRRFGSGLMELLLIRT
jgi:hypothetical protein